MGNCSASYLFDKHILLHLYLRSSQCLIMEKPRTFSSLQQRLYALYLQISELDCASVPYIPGSCA